MLDRMRQGASGWTAKVLLGLLIISFAVWGISGQFFGYGTGQLARVGDAEVTTQEFQRALRQRMDAISQRTGSPLTMEQARLFGIPQQVLSELITQAALQDQARDYNLGISDDELAEEIQRDPTFHGIGGRFDRARFQALLRNAGIREDDYVMELRHQALRNQILTAISSGITAPEPLVQAFYRYQNEQRTVAYLVVDEDAVEAPSEPDQAALEAYFTDNRAAFRAPEYRRIATVSLDASVIADPAAVSEADVTEAYERRRQEFTRTERRRIEQVRFESREAAEQAQQAIEGGKDLLEVAQERGLSPTDIDLGLKARPEIVDAKVAEAAFAAEQGTVVPVLDGSLGPAIIRVTAIEAGSVTPLAEVSDRLRADIARRAASARVLDVFDQIEDERAGGSTLEEAAHKLSLPYAVIESVDRQGLAPDGTEVADLPGGRELLAEAFETDVGVEADPVHMGDDSYVFFEVLDIVPERARTLDEARDDVLAAWRRDQITQRVEERTTALFDRLKAGEGLEALAQEIGKSVQRVENLSRSEPNAELSRNALAQAFAGPEGHVANAEAEDGAARILLQVETVSAPAFFAEAESAQSLQNNLTNALQNDLLQAYAGQLMQSRPVTVNNALYAQLTGENRSQ